MINFDPPESPNICEHGSLLNIESCEKCDDDNATRADEIIKERKENHC